MAARVDLRASRLDGLCQHCGQVHRPPLQGDLALLEPGHVQQVAHQAGHLPQLPSDGLPGLAGGVGLAARQGQDVGGANDRGEMVAQLVRHDGQELVLAPFHLLQARRLLGVPELFLLPVPPGPLPAGRLLLVSSVAGHAGGDGLVEGQANGHHLPASEWPIQRFFEVVEDDQAEDLVVADDLGQRPAVLPARLAVLGGRRAVPAAIIRVDYAPDLKKILITKIDKLLNVRR